MFTDFERKVRQIIRNDRAQQRVTNLDDLEQRTGHSREEIEAAIEKLKNISIYQGGLKK